MVYQYTRKKFAKIPQNTQNSSKYTQNYTQVYLIPEIQRKWYTEYPYLSCNIPYTRFKKPRYTVYPKTLADPDFSFKSSCLCLGIETVSCCLDGKIFKKMNLILLFNTVCKNHQDHHYGYFPLVWYLPHNATGTFCLRAKALIILESSLDSEKRTTTCTKFFAECCWRVNQRHFGGKI